MNVENGIRNAHWHVPWPLEKVEAASAVQYVAGVRDVVNHIVVFNATPAAGLGPPDERL